MEESLNFGRRGILPEKLLYDRFNRVKEARDVKLCGIAPERWLCDRSSDSSSCKFPIFSAMLLLRKLLDKFKMRSAERLLISSGISPARLQNWSGIGPLIKFEPRRSMKKDDNFSTHQGRLPKNLLPPRSMLVKPEQFCNEDGISPSRLLLLNSSTLREDRKPKELGMFPVKLLLDISMPHNVNDRYQQLGSSPENLLFLRDKICSASRSHMDDGILPLRLFLETYNFCSRGIKTPMFSGIGPENEFS
ncbi:hypothetical protein QQP08_006147 [Theobroma cacao]|nr:hypothetical protein QQP08_006147 [Theobroma cacao]